jgi:hypothetical protein
MWLVVLVVRLFIAIETAEGRRLTEKSSAGQWLAIKKTFTNQEASDYLPLSWMQSQRDDSLVVLV